MTDVRLADSLAFNCGPIIMDAVRDPDVLEIMLNPDGKIWIEKYGKDQECVGELPIAQSKVLLSLVASALDLVVDAQNPVVEGSFPLDGSRFEGTFPPNSYAYIAPCNNREAGNLYIDRFILVKLPEKSEK